MVYFKYYSKIGKLPFWQPINNQRTSNGLWLNMSLNSRVWTWDQVTTEKQSRHWPLLNYVAVVTQCIRNSSNISRMFYHSKGRIVQSNAVISHITFAVPSHHVTELK